MLVVFSGGSGVGKNTIIEHLLLSDVFSLLPTYTTRLPRANESEGNPYYFISEERFQHLIDLGDFYEYNIVHGHYYGTSRTLFQKVNDGKRILLKDIDVMGTQNLVNTLGQDTKILTIFLRVDSKDTLVKRLKERKEQEIEKRLSRYELEQTYQNHYDYIITNDVLEETIAICQDIIEWEKESKFLKSSQSIRFMNDQRVYEWADEIKKNKLSVPPIDAATHDHEVFVIDGHHRYLASILTGVRISTRIVVPKFIDEYEQYSWLDSIDFFLKRKVEDFVE